MPIFFNKTVTIWNKYTKDNLRRDEVWQPTVIENVWYQISRGNNIQNSGNSAADSVRLHINDKVSKSKKKFMPAAQWRDLDDELKQKYYTLESEDESFFTCNDTSEVDLDNIQSVFEYMKLHKPDVYRITSVDRFDSLIPHFEIWGK